DDLHRFMEGIVIWIYSYLSENGTYWLVDTSAEKFCTKSVLDIITNVTLAHSGTYRHGNRSIVGVYLSKFIHGSMDHACLRSIAVGNDNISSGFYQINQDFCGSLQSGLLFRQGSAQCSMA